MSLLVKLADPGFFFMGYFWGTFITVLIYINYQEHLLFIESTLVICFCWEFPVIIIAIKMITIFFIWLFNICRICNDTTALILPLIIAGFFLFFPYLITTAVLITLIFSKNHLLICFLHSVSSSYYWFLLHLLFKNLLFWLNFFWIF